MTHFSRRSKETAKAHAELLARAGYSQVMIEQMLDRMGYSTEVADEVVATSEPAEPVGLREAATDTLRETMHLPQLLKTEVRREPDVAREAQRRVAEYRKKHEGKRELVDDLLLEVQQDPRALRDWEAMAMLDEMSMLAMSATRTGIEVAAARSVAERTVAAAQFDLVHSKLDALTAILQRAGSEAGRSLRILQAWEQDQRSEDYLMHRLRVAKNGVAITEADVAVVKTVAARYRELSQSAEPEIKAESKIELRRAERVVKWLEAKKLKTGGRLEANFFGLSRETAAHTINFAIDTAIMAVRAGQALDVAIRRAIGVLHDAGVKPQDRAKFKSTLVRELTREYESVKTSEQLDAERAKRAEARVKRALQPASTKSTTQTQVEQEFDAMFESVFKLDIARMATERQQARDQRKQQRQTVEQQKRDAEHDAMLKNPRDAARLHVAQTINAAADAAIAAQRDGKPQYEAMQAAFALMQKAAFTAEQVKVARSVLQSEMMSEMYGSASDETKDVAKQLRDRKREKLSQRPPKAVKPMWVRVEEQKNSEMFDSLIERAKYERMGKWGKTWRNVIETSNLMRVTQTMWDLSMVGLQGGFNALSHPVTSARRLGKTFASSFKDETARAQHFELTDHPLYAMALDDGKVDFTSLAALEGVKMDEVMASRWALKVLPGAKWSNRMFSNYMNSVRMELFETMVRVASNDGTGQDLSKEELRNIGFFVNVSTGRGELGSFGRSISALSTWLYAPRYMVSRVQLLTGTPLLRSGVRTPRVTKAIAWELFRAALGWSALTSAVLMAGGEFDLDDKGLWTGKMRMGNVRFNFTAGLAQYYFLLTRIGIAAYQKSQKKPSDYDIGQLFGRFARSKLAPAVGSTYQVLDNRDFNNREYANTSSALFAQILGAAPLAWQSTMESALSEPLESANLEWLQPPPEWTETSSIMEEYGPGKAALAQVADLVGLSLQHYDKDEQAARRKAKARVKRRIGGESR